MDRHHHGVVSDETVVEATEDYSTIANSRACHPETAAATAALKCRPEVRVGLEGSPRVSTWLLGSERARVELAALPGFKLVHRDMATAVAQDLRHGRAHAAIISLGRLVADQGAGMSALFSGFHGRVIIGLALDVRDADAVFAAARLGAVGVQVVVDGREPDGFSRLRSALGSAAVREPWRSDVLGRIHHELSCAPPSCHRFFDAVFDSAIASAREVATRLGVNPSTLSSRFVRAKLPSPKLYLAAMSRSSAAP